VHPLRNVGATLAVLLGVALLALSPAQAADRSAPTTAQLGALAVQQSIDPASQPVQGGETFTYAIRISHTGGAAPLQVEFRNALDPGLRLAPGFYVEEVSFRLRVEYERAADGRTRQVVSGIGAIPPDTTATLRLPVQVYTDCNGTGANETLVNTILATPPEGAAVRSALNVVRTCPTPVLDEVAVQIVEICTQTLAEPLGIQAGQCGNQIGKKIIFTNQADRQLIVGYRLDWSYIGETEKNLATASIVLKAGEERIIEVWTDMRPLSRIFTDFDAALMLQPRSAPAADDGLGIAVTFNLFTTILTDVQERPRIDPRSPNIAQETLSVRFRAWGFGDAPASVNSFGTPMTAYPGVPANFPTVFDPANRATGPAHARPRHFHLGRGVSVAPNADLGASPNLDPLSNTADQAPFDDGALPQTWNFTHCQSTTVDIRIFISPHAADWFAQHNLRGYLNAWIDANRDGDWADSVVCADNRSRALEHFIIDHSIDVARLGPGYHALRVPTGAVPWPADQAPQPAWLRITLSEQPSVKVGTAGGVAFGDGRGPARPFLTGETEDYLIRPTGAAGSGPDMEVRLSGNWHPVPEQLDKAASLAFTYQKIEWTVRASYANRGNERAENAVLNVELPPGVSGRDARITLPPELRRDAVTINDRRITVNLGAVEPGQGGQIAFTFQRLGGDEIAWLTKADVIALRDVNPTNNTAEWLLEVRQTTPASFGFRSPAMDFTVQRGTTNSSTLILEGQVQGLLLPAVQRIWVQQVMVGMGQKDAYVVDPLEPFQIPIAADGRWSLTLNDLPDGLYQFAVGDQAACTQNARTLAGNDNEWRRSLHGVGIVCGLGLVDRSLPIDPISMRFVEVPADAAQALKAPTYLPDTYDPADYQWRLRLFDTNPEDGVTRYMLQLNGRPGAEIYFGITGFGSFENKLTEVAPGRYETNFIMGDGGSIPNLQATGGALSLRATLDDVERRYTGELIIEAPGQVRDARSGAVLPDATITPLASARNGAATILAPQNRRAVTDRAGVYRLTNVPGVEQIVVTAAGYQPYRIDVSDRDGLVGANIRLSPMIAEPPDVVVAITERGFDPAILQVRPGQIVHFVNTGDRAHGVAGEAWESGLLLPGERYAIRAENAGAITLNDTTDPSRSGTIVVAPAQPTTYRLYLPFTRR
jgi:plastocyanin